MTITGFLDCPICGDLVPQTATRAKRRYHTECKKFKNHLDAAVRAGEQIEPFDEQTKRVIRGLLARATYRFRSPQPRGDDGRFVSGNNHDD